MEKFKINGSSTGKIMGVKGLGKTGQTFLKEKIIQHIFNRKKEFSNKYTQKGNIVENGSIEFADKYLKLGGIEKNEEEFFNESMIGTPDVITEELIIDIKSSWDCFTFPFFNTEIPSKDYYWQAQTYMELLGHDNYKLIYVLMDTPTHLIERESYYWCKENGVEDLEGQVFKQFQDKFTYSDIKPKNRLKVFNIKRNKEDIKKIYSRVEECREYISKLKY